MLHFRLLINNLNVLTSLVHQNIISLIKIVYVYSY